MSSIVLRVGLGTLAGVQALIGLAQLLAPARFYDTLTWVAMFPPYNEHLIRDLGAATLAFVLPLAVAAVTLDRLMVRTGLAASLLYTGTHFVFHALHLDDFSIVDAIAQTLALGALVVVSMGLLVLHEATVRRARPAPSPRR